MAIDPVCGMDIDEEKASARTAYDGETFYFCSQDCKREFLEEPEIYVELLVELLEGAVGQG